MSRIKLGEDPLHIPLIHTELWVFVRKFRLDYFTKDVAKDLGDFIGLFLEYDCIVRKDGINETIMWIRVCMDMTKTLHWKRKLIYPDGYVFYAFFSYECIMCFAFYEENLAIRTPTTIYFCIISGTS